MNRNEQHDDLIDLGTASVETLGNDGTGNDEALGKRQPGLSND